MIPELDSIVYSPIGGKAMKILVINAGSSSLKYQLIDMENESVVAKGICERIGMNDGIFSHKTFDGREKNLTTDMEDHTQAFQLVKDALIDSKVGVIQSLSEVAAIGHRVVQGGSIFSKSVLITDDVLKGIESLNPLAPLHNPAHVQGIRACQDVFGTEVPQGSILIQPSIPQCHQKLIRLRFLMNIMRNMQYAATVSTELPINTLAIVAQKLWENQLKN